MPVDIIKACRSCFSLIFSCVAVILPMLCLPLKSDAAEPLRIGVLYWSMNIPGQVAMRQGLESEAKKINREAVKKNLPQVKLLASVAGDGQDGITLQIKQMHDLIRQKPDVIIVQPTNNAALAAPLREANRAGIPVVAYDQYISGGTLAAYITSDNYQAGYLDGEYIAHRFSGKGRPVRLVLVNYPHISSTVERVNGFLDALKERKQQFILLKSYEAVEPAGGRAAAKSIVKDFPERHSVDAIFTINDGGGLAIVDALAKAGRNEIMVATVDGDPASVENIRRKRLTVINTAQFCGPLGAQAMIAAYTIATGGKVARHQLVPVFPVTTETIGRYPGWLGPIPAAFVKSWPSSKPRWEGAVSNLRNE